MDEDIKKSYHYSTKYALIKNGERIEFNSEQEACEKALDGDDFILMDEYLDEERNGTEEGADDD